MASSSGNPNFTADGAPQINWPPSEQDMKNADTPRNTSLKSSRAYSVASPAADKSRRAPLKADNPGSIPTAGGQTLGGRAMEQREYRRKSMMSFDSGKAPASASGAAPAALDREGSPDVVTQNNTEANTIPARMHADNGEGSSKVEPIADPDPLEKEKSPSAPPQQLEKLQDVDAVNENDKPTITPVANDGADGVAPDDTTAKEAVAPNDTAAKAPVANDAVAKDETPASQPANAQKERRGSRMEDFLGKLKLGSKKK